MIPPGWLFVAVVGLSLGAQSAQAQAPSPCLTEPGPAPVVEAAAAVDREPADVNLRFTLADTLIAEQCYPEAVRALEAANEAFPQDRELETRLRDARSLLEEQGYFADLERAEELAAINHNLLRCRRLNDLAACDEALRARPGDADTLIAKGNALLELNRPSEALPVFSQVSQSEPGNDAASAGHDAARDQRQAALATCLEREDEDALAACDRALLRGADDEFSVHERRGYLLQRSGNSVEALDAYIAANALRADDPAVAQAIVALSESTGRDDPVTLAMRGGALLALGQPNQAIVTLRQALALNPDLTDAQGHLELAEGQRRDRVETCRQEDGAAGLEACEDALLEGEADEFDIRVRMATLLLEEGAAADAKTELQTAAALRPDESAIQTRLADIESQYFAAPEATVSAQEPAVPVAAAGAEADTEEGAQGRAGQLPDTPIVISEPPRAAAAGAEVSTPAQFSNAAFASGRTH